MVEGIRNARGAGPLQSVETPAARDSTLETPDLRTVTHPRRRWPSKIASRLVAMTIAGASILLTAGAVLGANHTPARGKPLTETHARSTGDSVRWVSTRPLISALGDARLSLSDVESKARHIQTRIDWYEALLAKIERGDAPEDRRAEAEGVIARDREALRGMSGELAAARAQVAVAEKALQPWIEEAARSLQARGLPTARRDASPQSLIDAAAVAEAWVNRHGSLPRSTDRIHWLLAGGHTKAILDALANHPQPLFSDPIELGAAAPLDPIAWQRAETLRDRFDYRPDARDLEPLASLDDAGFERLLALFAELREKAGFVLTESSRADRLGGEWSLADVGTLTEIVWDGHGFWLDPPSLLSAQRPTFELPAFVAAAQLLFGRGISFEAEHTALVALLASSLETEKRAALFLLDHVALSGHAGESEQLARAARFGGPTGRALDETSFALIRGASSRMGRLLSVGEASLLLSSKRPLDTLLPPLAVTRAHALDPHATIQDVALFASDPKLGTEEPQLSAGVSRNDRAAEYSESWAEAKSSLTKGDRIRIDLLLDFFRSAEGRAAVRDAVARDLAEDHAELGGQIALGDALQLLVVPSAPGNNNSYVYPDDAPALLGALVPFHLHAIDPNGNPFSAGPSSFLGGREGDLGASRNRGLAEIVITHLDRDRFGVDYYTPNGTVLDLGTFSYLQ